MEYYVFATLEEAEACLTAINNSGWFPVTGNTKGVPAPNNQLTTKWMESPLEMSSGEWCVVRIQPNRLEALDVTSEEQSNFLAVYGNDIRVLSHEDFPVIESERL